MKTVAKLYVRNDWCDEEVKQVVERMFFQSVDELYVLPVYVERVKNLLQGLITRVGSFVDYPFALGTPEKKAFEIVNLFQKGADKLLIPIFFHPKNEESYIRLKELHSILQSFIFCHRDLVYLLNTQMLMEKDWIEVAQKFKILGIREIAFEVKDVAKGVMDVSAFHKVIEGQISFSVYVSSDEEFLPTLFFDLGASGVGRIIKPFQYDLLRKSW